MSEVFNRNEPGFRNLENRVLEMEKARASGGLMVFGSAPRGPHGPRIAYTCLQCARRETYPHQSNAPGFKRCPVCEPDQIEEERV